MKHLTDKQKQHIFNTAVELIHEDIRHDQDYLNRIIQHYVNARNIEVQLAIISSDEDCQTHLLGFDPQTGKEVELE